MFRRVLVANRGEIALRIMRACRALGAEAVAVYSQADRDSPHLAEADEAICIGGPQSHESYLNTDAILMAARQTDCQALHPGYGFLAENALFAARCNQQQLTFIGPTPGDIRRMGDKATAKRTMRAAGLPTIPGSEGTVADLEAARAVTGETGFPVLLKATAGGGGKGMRICRDAQELAQSWAEATLEAQQAFGNPGLYVERFFAGARHIEFQFLADRHGHAVHLGERECSVQRSHQKLVEESPSPALDAERRCSLGARTVAAVEAIGYVNAGTVEFLLAPGGELYFMEMNTRLQVEHPVTEMVTGLDIVQEQLKIAANCPLSVQQEEVRWSGHAIECRLNAEDPERDFRPSPGTLTAFEPPPGVANGNVRLDSHARTGYTIPPFYDSLIGKLIVHAADRPAAIAAMLAALGGMRIEGVATTIPLHERILRSPGFASGDYDTGCIRELLG